VLEENHRRTPFIAVMEQDISTKMCWSRAGGWPDGDPVWRRRRARADVFATDISLIGWQWRAEMGVDPGDQRGYPAVLVSHDPLPGDSWRRRGYVLIEMSGAPSAIRNRGLWHCASVAKPSLLG
jgi:hypothetical protein